MGWGARKWQGATVKIATATAAKRRARAHELNAAAVANMCGCASGARFWWNGWCPNALYCIWWW